MNAVYSPDQLSEQGKQAFQQGRFLEAASSFEAASQGYQAAGEPLSAAENDNNRSVALLKAEDPEGALRAVGNTDDVFAKAGDIRRQAMALGNKGAAYQALERVEEAIQAYEQADALFKQVGEREYRAPVLQALAALQMKTGRQYEAMATLQASLDEVQKPNPFQRFLRKLVQLPLKIFFRS